MALITALLFLLLFSALGAAMLTLATLDIRITDSYHTAAELVYTADAGIQAGLAAVRASPSGLPALFEASAGGDGSLSGSRDSDVLLANPADYPLINAEPFHDIQGSVAGQYSVFLRNDLSDGATVTTDTNHAFVLLSVAFDGPARRVIEAAYRRPALPRPHAAVVIGGDFPDVDVRLRTPAPTERFVELLASNAADIHHPGWPGTTRLGPVGNPGEYRVVLVNGDCQFGPGSGYGLLLVRGELTFEGSFTWNGVIVVAGQGVLRWPEGSYGQISGAVILARTRGTPGPGNPLGSVLAVTGDAVAELAGDGFAELNLMEIDRVNRLLRYGPESYREY